jgi:hypothetical protein
MGTYASDTSARLTDHDIVAATYSTRVRACDAAGQRTYRAIYESGIAVTFAVGHAEAARVYAREYGTRIIHERLMDVRWNR